MEKKTCKTCGKTWIIEKFDQHLCTALPKKSRKSPVKSPVKSPAKDKAGTATEKKHVGPPLISFRRMS